MVKRTWRMMRFMWLSLDAAIRDVILPQQKKIPMG